MFECCLEQGELFKKIIMAISDLVQDGNFQINGDHISFQGMDSSHVSLVALSLKESGFKQYRCDRELTLGINFGSLNKVLKCMSSNDKLSLKCQDNGDTIFLCYENQKSNRISNFELKLMDIDQEQLGIPETNYAVNVSIPAQLFQKIIRDLSQIGDSITISVNKQGVKFSVNGDIGKGDVMLSGTVKKVKKSDKDKDKNKDNDGDSQVKNEDDQQQTQQTKGADDEDDDMKDTQQQNNDDNNDETKENDNDDNNNDDDDDINAVDGESNEEEDVYIVMNDDVSQTFAARYLTNFTKATTVSAKVTLSMGADVPLKCHYKIDSLGDIAYYLAPKIDDDE